MLSEICQLIGIANITDCRQIPWVGCALGMIVSSLLVVLDYLSFGHTSYIAHPLLKILSCAVSSFIGYG